MMMMMMRITCAVYLSMITLQVRVGLRAGQLRAGVLHGFQRCLGRLWRGLPVHAVPDSEPSAGASSGGRRAEDGPQVPLVGLHADWYE